MPDSRSFERTDDVTAWCEYCFHAVTSSGSRKFAKGYRERLYNPDKHKNLHNIDTIIRDEKTFAAFHKDPQDDAIIFTGTTSDGQTVEIITKLDKYGNINADFVEVTALTSGKNKVVPPPKPLTEVVEAVANRHQEAGYLPSTGDNLPSTAENASGEFGNSSRKSISPEADAECLSAVERGDMEAAQRMVEEAARKKGIKKFISVHYAGLRNPVTALDVLNIGDVIKRGKITEEGNSDYPTSRRYELQAEDGAMLKVIVDFNRKKDKNRSVINFYSDRESDPRGQASSGGITDLSNNLLQLSDNASGGTGKTSEKINGGTDEYGDDNSRLSISPEADEELELVRGGSEMAGKKQIPASYLQNSGSLARGSNLGPINIPEAAARQYLDSNVYGIDKKFKEKLLKIFDNIL